MIWHHDLTDLEKHFLQQTKACQIIYQRFDKNGSSSYQNLMDPERVHQTSRQKKYLSVKNGRHSDLCRKPYVMPLLPPPDYPEADGLQRLSPCPDASSAHNRKHAHDRRPATKGTRSNPCRSSACRYRIAFPFPR